jgi:hypothetical protein
VDALEREVEGLRTAAGGLEQEHQVLLSLLALLVQSTNLYWYKSTTVVMQMRADASIMWPTGSLAACVSYVRKSALAVVLL